MLTLVHLEQSAYVAKPWKNGLGKAWEIAADPDAPCRWRVSVADVPASGPFSAYEGYDRALVLLEGGPLTLHHEGEASAPLAPLGIEHFAGERATSSVVDAPARVLNVFSMRGKAEARVSVHTLEQGASLTVPADAQEHFVYGVSGDVVVAQQGEEHGTVSLSAGDAVRVTGLEGAARELNVRAWAAATFVVIAFRLV